MKIITFDDINNLKLDKSVYYSWAKEIFTNKYSSILPPKISMKHYNGEGFVNVMPCILPDSGVYGVKVVSRNPNSVPTLKSNLMLFDEKTNDLLSVMDADYITAFRTGATATLAIETLARKGYSTIGLIGLGNICRAVVLVLLSVVKDRKLTLKLHMFENTDNGLGELLSQFDNVVIEHYDSIEETVRDSDVVISCVTFAEKDLAKPEWFKKGALLVPVHTRGFMDCDLVFDRVIVDDFGHVHGFKNYEHFKNCHELSEVLHNPKLGRNNDDERIIAYNIGLSILDLGFAKKLYDYFKEKEDIEVSKKLDTYWVR